MTRIFVLIVLFSCVSYSVISQVPRVISYQGIIINPTTKETVADGPHSVKFRFYDAPENGNFKWETSTIQVTTFKGLFTTIIPVPENATWNEQLYVDVIADGVERGRIRLTTVPYAFTANSALVAFSMDAAGLTGTIPPEKFGEHLQDLASDGELSGGKVGSGIKAANITDASAGALPNTILDDDLQDLADGELSGVKVGNGIKAAHVSDASAGKIPNEMLDEDLQDLAIDGILSGSRLEGLDATKITSGTFDVARIPDLDASKITTGSIGGARIGDGIKASNITDASAGTIPNAMLDTDLADLAEDGLLTASKLTGDGLLPNAVLHANLQDLAADGVLSNAGLAPGIDGEKISDGTITSTKIGDGTVATADIANDAITSPKIAAAAVGTTDIADNAITTTKIFDGTIATVDMADNAVTSAKVLDGAVGTADIANDAITSPKIAAAAVGTTHIADNAITTAKIFDGTIATNDVADAAITNAKLASDINASKISAGTFDATRIPNLDAAKITSGTLPVSRGGTGVTTATNGQLLIGNGTGFSAATLTQGTGISINNSAGAITISNTGGTVTNVSASTPLSISNPTTTPTISMTQATTSQSGYLSSTDWNTFNNKLSTFPNQNANLVYAGPSSGLPASPSFRTLSANDIPSLDAAKITSGTLSTARLPSNLAIASGTTNRLAYWTSSTQLSGTGLYWDDLDNDLGINNSNPEAGVHITHASGVDHVNGTALKISNTYSSTKRGIDIDLTQNGSASATGIDVNIEGTGTGGRTGISSNIVTHVTNSNIVNAITANAQGDGTGSHRGIYAVTLTTGGGRSIGVFGESLNSGPLAVGVYGKAAGTGYGVYCEGKAAIIGDFGVEGDVFIDGTIDATGPINENIPSDRKLKKNIQAIPASLKKILQIESRTYFFRKDEFPRLKLEGDKQYGLIAQELEKIFPELITEKKMGERRDANGNITEPELTYKAVDYTSLIPILIKGMQEQQAIIEQQQKSIDKLATEVKELKASTSNNSPGKRFVKTSSNK